MNGQPPPQSKPAFRRNLLEKYLRQQIQLRQDCFDEPLGTELQLAETYHLSRNTVRKVLQQLQNEGLLMRKTGFGTFIVPPEKRPAGKAILRKILLATNWHANDFYVQRLVSGILEYAYPRNTRLDIVHYDTLSAGTMIANYRALKYDAVIHDRPMHGQNGLIREMASAGIPQVVINRSIANVPSLFVDHRNAVQQVVRFFSGLGLSRICFVDMPRPEPLFLQRQTFFSQELARQGISNPDEYVFLWQQDEDNACKCFNNYLAGHPETEAVFVVRPAVSDVLEVLKARGLSVPEDISLIMLDEDSRNPEFQNITVFREPIQQLGFIAAEVVFNCHSDKESTQTPIFLPGELIVRDSCRYPFGSPRKIELKKRIMA